MTSSEAPSSSRSFACRSEVGYVRERNEDSVLLLPDAGLLAVFDGVGGHPAGDVASQTAARYVADAVSVPPDADDERLAEMLADLLLGAHRSVLDAVDSDTGRPGMATTAVVAVVRDGRAVVAHVGDSRAYVVAGGTATQVTTDHGVGAMLHQALGLSGGVQPDSVVVDLPAGATLLLCTDGLSDMLDDGTIASAASDGDADAVADALVAGALQAGGVDNVTVAVART